MSEVISSCAWLRTEAAAKRCGLSASFLEKMRFANEGPPFSRVGKAVLYGVSDLDSWLLSLRHDGEAA